MPDRSCRYYYELLRLGSAAILKIAEHAVVTAEDRIILTAIATHCDLVEKRWDAISRFCDRIPPTLVHGDLASKNICVRTDHRDTHFLVMDWESAGWGVPAADLAQSTFGSASPDLEVYWSVVQPEWPPQLAFTDLQRLAEVGNLFRVVSALKWANSGFRPEFLEWYMMNMRFYESALRAWLERAAAYE